MTEKVLHSAVYDEGLHVWFEDVAARLAAGGTVVFAPRGTSMWPSLRPASDRVVMRRHAAYRRGDMVLARAVNPEGIFLHRVVSTVPGGYVLMGDANTTQRELCMAADVAGRVDEVVRCGRSWRPSVIGASPYLLPVGIRRYAVALIKRLFPL